ncbi:MAG TPA: hypothetical protein VFN53_00395 [Acidobacteriaceae bacterium]|nr:hypothetical protein [Acidobacteriaceae bacterium]
MRSHRTGKQTNHNRRRYAKHQPLQKYLLAPILCLTAALGFSLTGCGGGTMHPPSSTSSRFKKAATQQWIRQFGTGTVSHGDDQGDSLTGIATDSQGNVVAAGFTTGTFPGFTNANGAPQDFVAKFSPAGTQLWLQQFGTPNGDELAGDAVDAQSNIALAGVTRGAFPGFSNPNHNLQTMVEKLDSSGHLLWRQQFSVATTTTVAGVATDNQGNVFLSGELSPSPYPNQTALLNVGFPAFGTIMPMSPMRLYVEKLNGATGAQEWIQVFGNENATDTVSGIAVDGQGDPVLVGTSSGTFPGNVYPTDMNASLPFVLKLSGTTGNALWLQQPTMSSFPSGYFYNAVAVNAAGNVVVDGQGLVQSVGAPQCLLFEFSGADGHTIWNQYFGGGQQSLVGGLSIASDGSILVGGFARGAFLPAFTANIDDVFVAKFTPAGKPVSIQQFGTGKEIEAQDSQTSSPIAVATDAQNDTFVGGMTTGAFPGSKNPNGAQEIFVAKFGPQ